MPPRHLIALFCCFLSASCVGPGGKLPHLMAERLSWMDEVAQVKHVKKLPVTDPIREAELLQAMERKGATQGLPAPAVRAFFSGQMDAAKQVQTEWLRVHKDIPGTGKALPDLATTVRPALDAIGEKMLSDLVAARAKRTTHALQTVEAARARLTKAGYSPAVITPAVTGLEAALK